MRGKNKKGKKRTLYLEEQAFAAFSKKTSAWNKSASEIVSSLIRIFSGLPANVEDEFVAREFQRCLSESKGGPAKELEKWEFLEKKLNRLEAAFNASNGKTKIGKRKAKP